MHIRAIRARLTSNCIWSVPSVSSCYLTLKSSPWGNVPMTLGTCSEPSARLSGFSSHPPGQTSLAVGFPLTPLEVSEDPIPGPLLYAHFLGDLIQYGTRPSAPEELPKDHCSQTSPLTSTVISPNAYSIPLFEHIQDLKVNMSKTNFLVSRNPQLLTLTFSFNTSSFFPVA